MPTTSDLYQLAARFRLADAAIDEAEGELTPELEATLDTLHAELPEWADSVGTILAEIDGDLATLRAERDRLNGRIRSCEARAARWKYLLEQALDAAGEKAAKGRLFKARVAANSAPSVTVLVDPAELPCEYQRVRIDADKAKLADRWKAGLPLPEGVAATIGRHVRIS
jgi:hypothetical protein